MDQAIIKPRAYQKRYVNNQQTIGGETGIPNGTNSFLASSFVVVSGGYLTQIASQAILTCGLCIDSSHPAGVVNPPSAFFADNHWPIAPQGVQFLINIGTLSGGATGSAVVGQANSAKQISNVTVGTSYGVAVATTGTYAGYEFLDPTNTTQLLFTVVGIPTLRGVAPQGAPEGQTTATYNGIVIVELVSGTTQVLN